MKLGKSTILGFSLSLLSSGAAALPFGDMATAHSASLPACQNTDVLTLPVTVDVPGRIYVSATAQYPGWGAEYSRISYYVRMFNVDENGQPGQLVGSISPGGADVPTNYTSTLVSSGILGGIQDAPYKALTVPAGQYVLTFMMVPSGGNCAGAGTGTGELTLTYMLLSSVRDRIFAAGFS